MLNTPDVIVPSKHHQIPNKSYSEKLYQPSPELILKSTSEPVVTLPVSGKNDLIGGWGSFKVTYKGTIGLESKWFLSAVVPWIMAEIRNNDAEHIEAILNIAKGTVSVRNWNDRSDLLFQHDLQVIIKFCMNPFPTLIPYFAYVTKNQHEVCDCHLFQTTDSSIILDIFKTLRYAAKDACLALKSDSDKKQGLSSPRVSDTLWSQSYEIMHIGQKKMQQKNAPGNLIDELAEKMERRDTKTKTHLTSEKMNELMPDTGVSGKKLGSHSDSYVFTLQLQDEREKMAKVGPKTKQKHDSTSSIYMSSLEISQPNCDVRCSTTSFGSLYFNPIMLLMRIGKKEILFVNPDRRYLVEVKKFGDVAYVSQGVRHPEYFGLVCRENLNIEFFTLYLFKCQYEKMVDEILTSLQTAFNACWNGKLKHINKDTCPNCPLSLFKSLCQDVEGLSSDPIKKHLLKWISNYMFEREKRELLKRQKVSSSSVVLNYHQNSSHPSEMENEVTVALIRHFCIKSQSCHVHKFDIEDKNQKINAKSFTLPDLFKRIGYHNDLFDEDFSTKVGVNTLNNFNHFETICDKTSLNRHSQKDKLELDLAIPTLNVGTPGTKEVCRINSNGVVICDVRNKLTMSPRMLITPDPAKSVVDDSYLKGLDSRNEERPSSCLDDDFCSEATCVASPIPLIGLEKTMFPVHHRNRNKSWRHNIYNKIILPYRLLHKDSTPQECVTLTGKRSRAANAQNNSKIERKLTREDYRTLWKKAISEQILLNRMERENDKLRKKRNLLWMRLGKYDFSFHKNDENCLPQKTMLDMEERIAKKLHYDDAPVVLDTLRVKWEIFLAKINNMEILPCHTNSEIKLIPSKPSDELRQIYHDIQFQIETATKQGDEVVALTYEGLPKFMRGNIWLTLIKLKVRYKDLNDYHQHLAFEIVSRERSSGKTNKNNPERNVIEVSCPQTNDKPVRSSGIPKISRISPFNRSPPFVPLPTPVQASDTNESDLFDKPEICPIPSSRLGNNTLTMTYDNLLKIFTPHQHSILIDISRSFPAHPYFEKSFGEGQLCLYNLLKAYSLIDPEVGYCQGLSYVAGILLMHMEEEDACETLKYLMFTLNLRDLYKPDMVALQKNLYSLSRLIKDFLPDLYEHFDYHNVYINLYAPPWFLTLFASEYPLHFVVRIFDFILVQDGVMAVFKAALILLYQNKDKITDLDSMEDVANYLKNELKMVSAENMAIFIEEMEILDIIEKIKGYEIEYNLFNEYGHHKNLSSKLQDSHMKKVQGTSNDKENLLYENIELKKLLQDTKTRVHELERQMKCQSRIDI